MKYVFHRFVPIVSLVMVCLSVATLSAAKHVLIFCENTNCAWDTANGICWGTCTDVDPDDDVSCQCADTPGWNPNDPNSPARCYCEGRLSSRVPRVR